MLIVDNNYSIMSKKDLYILMLEDDPFDAEINKQQIQHLEEYNCFIHWVQDKETYLHAVKELKFDLILSDYNLPQYNGLEALHDLKGLNQQIPFIFVTGTLNEETAAETIKSGAWDYVVKDRLIRLPLAIRSALLLKEERKQLNLVEEFNKKLIMAVEQSPSHILITDTRGDIEYVNNRFSEVTGYSYKELLGHTPSMLKSGYHSIAFYEELWNTIRNGQIWRGEIYNRKKDGSYFWESASISPLKNADGKITHYVGVKEDITLKKKMEQEIIESRDKAEYSDKLKTVFLQNMSHEIRTPLNAITGFSSLLDDITIEPEQRKEYISIILNSSTQLTTIVEDILTVSRIQTKQESLNLKTVKVGSIMNQNYSLFSSTAKNKNLELIYKIDPGTENFEFQTDEIKINQVFSNLLNNAIKYTQEGTIEIGYSLREDEIEFYIKDTGIGIEENMQDIIFEQFTQAELTMSRTYGGNGLGLAIAKAFVKLHGGKIWVKSKHGKGSTFYFTIPLRNNITATNQPVEAHITNNSAKQITILVAEDEENNYYLIEQILSKSNYIILHAENGKKAVEICQNHSEIGLVLMDIKMPDMDGQTALTEIRKSHPNLPIIAQTAYALEQEREYLLNNGFNDYISKPIKKDVLIRKVEQWSRLKNFKKS